MFKSRVRKPRTVSEEVSYTVTVSEDVKVGDFIFTVPDQKFEKKWFEVVSDGTSPVQMERDSGRVYLAYRLMSPAEVMVKIHNMRGILYSLFLSHSLRVYLYALKDSLFYPQNANSAVIHSTIMFLTCSLLYSTEFRETTASVTIHFHCIYFRRMKVNDD